MRLRTRLRATLLGLALTVAPTFARAQDSYAFVDVAVIPMDSNRVLPKQTVVVRDGRITALGPVNQVQVPAGALRIDGRGKFLIPGLGDMHVHPKDTTGAELFAYVANGVTTIRHMGYYPTGMRQRILKLRALAAQGALIGPRIYAADGPIMGSAVEDVTEAKAAGYDFVKIIGRDGPWLDSVAATARRLGIPIAGHAPPSLQRAIDVGYASIEHLFSFERYLGGPGALSWWAYWTDTTASPQQPRQIVADTAKLHALAVALRRANIWVCPTSAMFEALPLNAAAWPEMEYLTPTQRQKWQRIQNEYDARPVGPAVQAALEARATIVRALRDAGVGLLLGTDTGVHFMLAGFAVHHELQAFVRAGLSPYEALATGTRNVAAYFGTLDSTGTVAVGKRADLVLLTGNPLEDIRHTMQPAGVVLAGRWLDRAALDRGLAGLKGTFKGH